MVDNIDETKSMSNILFIHCKFFTCKMQEGDHLFDQSNKIKVIANQLASLEVPMRDEDTVMMLLESLSTSYKYLIMMLKTMLMNKLTMKYMTMKSMHQ